MKLIKNRFNILINKQAGITYFEIFILTLSMFAFAYIIAPEVSAEGSGTIQIPNLNSMSQNCCPKLKTNGTCQDILDTQCSDQCSVACLPTSCSQTASCKLGCCYDTLEGTCAVNAPQQTCTGTWKDDKSCNIKECQMGCCVIGDNTQLVTETRCKKLISFSGNKSAVFKSDIQNELSCLLLSHSQAKGACVLEAVGNSGLVERGCKYNSKEECVKLKGSFNDGLLCTAPILNTTCKKTGNTTCVEGKDEVYFVDSCGNLGNIYDARKKDDSDYWNKVISKDKSCSIPGAGCGNCKYSSGNKCAAYRKGQDTKPTLGNNICRDLNCKDAPANVGTQDRKNGESWCAYDSYVGDGKDVVGSRHWRYYCLDGEVKSEACGDFRSSICVEKQFDLNGQQFTNAACKINRWRECLDYNKKAKTDEKKSSDSKDSGGMLSGLTSMFSGGGGGSGETPKTDYTKVVESCKNNPDCYIRENDFGTGYKFPICLPKYPPGTDIRTSSEDAQKLCGIADFTCTRIEVKEMLSWKCVAGCECTSRTFTQQMNDWCVSLGDCGGYINLAGKAYEGYTVDSGSGKGNSSSSKQKIDLNQYQKYLTPVNGQKADPGNLTLKDFIGENGGFSAADFEPGNPSLITLLAIQIAKGIGLGSVAYGVSSLIPAADAGTSGASAGNLITVTGLEGSPWLAAMSGAAAAASAGSIVGYIVGSLFGVKGNNLFLVSCGSGTVGAVAAIGSNVMFSGAGYTQTVFNAGGLLGTPGTWMGWILPGLGWGLVAAIILSMALGGDDTKETEVHFTCMPYQAPTGGDDCKKCNDELNKDGLRACSKYRCESLGQTCELLNPGTGKEICIDNSPNDVSSPEISPWNQFLNESYEYFDIKPDGFSVRKIGEQCIKEFTPLTLGIYTNEPSQCKVDTDHVQDFEKMKFFFGESNIFEYNHSMIFDMPSVDSIVSSSGLEGAAAENYSNYLREKMEDLTLYVRCMDKNGNKNTKEYNIHTCVRAGPDTTAPMITQAEPEDGWVGFNSTTKDIGVIVNEPADCKYSLQDKTYSDMENNMSCRQQTLGTGCIATVGNLTNSVNKVYVRCKDQPWYAGTNESLRNVMSQSKILTLRKSSELKLLSITPNSSITLGQEPATINLIAKTSGGVPSLVECSYSFSGFDRMIRFYDTYSNTHTQVFDRMMRGVYTVYVTCSDVAGNTVSGTTGFALDLDTASPVITRVYTSGGKLIIGTDEKSTCYYSNTACGFDITNASKMKPDNSTEHFTEVGDQKNYYIICKDGFGNKPDCSVTVKTQ